MMNIELKPCPFCGSDNVKINYPVYYSGEVCNVQCYDCNCTTAAFYSPEKASEAWNRREGDEKQ